MQIKIGEQTHRTRRPADLGEQLLASTGFGLHEAASMIGASPSLAAQALRPFLGKEAPDLTAIAGAIADEPALIPAIQALYAADAPAEDEGDEGLTVTSYGDRYLAGEGREEPTMVQFAANHATDIEAEFQRRRDEAPHAG